MTGVLALAAGAAVAVTALLPASHPASQRPRVQLAAWTVVQQPGGIIHVTIRELRDPAGLQAALRADGVRPASPSETASRRHACPTPAAARRAAHSNRDGRGAGLPAVHWQPSQLGRSLGDWRHVAQGGGPGCLGAAVTGRLSLGWPVLGQDGRFQSWCAPLNGNARTKGCAKSFLSVTTGGLSRPL
jgi:hypothetical protein